MRVCHKSYSPSLLPHFSTSTSQIHYPLSAVKFGFQKSKTHTHREISIINREKKLELQYRLSPHQQFLIHSISEEVKRSYILQKNSNPISSFLSSFCTEPPNLAPIQLTSLHLNWANISVNKFFYLSIKAHTKFTRFIQQDKKFKLSVSKKANNHMPTHSAPIIIWAKSKKEILLPKYQKGFKQHKKIHKL